MIQRLIILLFLFVFIAFVFAAIQSGSIGTIADRAQEFNNPVRNLLESEQGGISFLSPIIEYPQVPFTTDGTVITGASGGSQNVQSELLALEEEYDRLQEQLREARVFGTPSPHVGEVTITQESVFRLVDPYSDTPERATDEYILLRASNENTAPVNITGWSLQSALTGARRAFPRGTTQFTMGTVNPVTDIYLNPGATVVVSSGVSPVGVSFRTNSCAGYLDQFQAFTPALTRSCPMPADELPDTIENIQRYGEACVDFVAELSQCRYFTDAFPANLSPQCRDFVRGALTYNSCVARHEWRPSFAGSEWRIFLGSRTELWRDTRDVIRLLDAEGRTVDVWSY